MASPRISQPENRVPGVLEIIRPGADKRGGKGTAIICELLRAVMHRDTRAPTDEFIMRGLVYVLIPPPTAHVVNENGLKTGIATVDIRNQPLLSLTLLESESTYSFIGIALDDLHAVRCRIGMICVRLVLCRIFLVIVRFAYVLCDGYSAARWRQTFGHVASGISRQT